MEGIISSLYQAKEELYFYAHFFFLLKNFLFTWPGRVPLYKQAPRSTIRGLTTLSGAALRARLHKAESYISWLHTAFPSHRYAKKKGPFKDH